MPRAGKVSSYRLMLRNTRVFMMNEGSVKHAESRMNTGLKAEV